MEGLLGAGTHPGMDPSWVQRVRLVNQVALFVALLLLPHVALFFAIGALHNALVQVAALAGLGASLLLNHLGRHEAARDATLLVGNALVCVMTIRLGDDSGAEYYAFAAVVAPLFFYSNREWRTIAAYVGLTVCASVGAQGWLALRGPVDPLPAWLQPGFFVACLVGGLLTVFAFVLYFYAESRRFEDSMKQANLHMQRLAETDALTGVANRRKIEQILVTEWGRAVRAKHPLSVVLVDVDHFKLFNDHYGHPAGDRVLTSLCGAFQAGVRRVYDVVGRYGGEEFLIILPEADAEGAWRVLERVRAEVLALGIPHARNEAYGQVTCSYGVASTAGIPEGDPFDLVRRADEALYRAKSEGRNRAVAG
ncbi:MAG: diguanylate cyclase [Myxococcota bacterium]